MKRKVSRLVSAILLAALVVTLTSSIALAFLYRASVTVTENASTSYGMLPVLWNQNNTWLVANGFMNSTANNTRVQTLGGLNKPWTVADNKTLTAIPVPADSQTNLYFVTGESASSAMNIIIGYGGYVTISDNASLEISNNGSTEYKGYVDAAAGVNKDLVLKTDAWRFYVSALNTLTLTVGTPGEVLYENATVGGGTANIWGANWYGQTFTSAVGHEITRVEMYGNRVLNPVGNLNVGIYATAAGVPVAPALASGSIVAATIGLPGAWISIPLSITTWITPGTMYAMVVSVPGGDAANHIVWDLDVGAGYAGGTEVTSAGSEAGPWAAVAGNDMTFREYGQVYATVSGACVSGAHTSVIGALSSGNLFISIDGAVTGTTAAVVRVPDNGNSWLLMRNNVMPYADYYKHTVNVTLVTRYEPTTMIIGTILPDKVGVNNGVITWGANPAGVGATIGSMASSGQPSIGGATDTSTSDLLPVAGGTDWRPNPGVSATLLANPMRPIVIAISDNTTLSEYQVWVWFGIIFVVFIVVLVGSRVRGHHLITGIAASAAIILLVVWTVFPLLSLLIVVLAIWGGLVSERSPSL